MADRLISSTFFGLCVTVVQVISAQSTVEGFVGGAVTLPCNVSIQGHLQWYANATSGATLVLMKPVNGQPHVYPGTSWTDRVCLVEGTNNMRISSLTIVSDNNRTFSCQGSSGGGPQETVVRVLDSPDVTLKWDSGKHVLTCELSGAPNSSHFDPWIHMYGGVTMRTVPANTSESIHKNTLHFSTMSVEDTGNYVCSVYDGTGETQKRSLYLKPNTGAIFAEGNVDYETEVGRAAEISVMFYSNPASSAVEWRTSESPDLIESHRETPSLVNLVFHGKAVLIQGIVTVLSLSHLPRSDNYTVTVITAVDGDVVTSSLTVTVRAKPLQPDKSGSNTGAIVGAIVGILGVVIVGVSLAVVFYRRHVQRKGSAATSDYSQQTYNRQNNGIESTVPRESNDNSPDPDAEQVSKYETLSDMNPSDSQSGDRAYDDLAAPTITEDEAYENTEFPDTSTISVSYQTEENYENFNLQT